MFLSYAAAHASSLDEARAFHRNGDYAQALEAYDKVANSAAPDADKAVARNNACVIHTDQGQFDVAEAYCREALNLRRALDDKRGVARTLNNYARVLQATGQFDDARQAHELALRSNIERSDLSSQIVNRVNLAVLETQARNYAAALDHLAAAEPLLTQVDEQWAEGQKALLGLNRAVIFERIGAYDDALTEIDATIKIATKAAPSVLADAYLNRGVILRNLGDAEAALDAYELAQRTFAERSNKVAAINATLNEAILYWRDLGDDEAAGQAVRDVLDSAASASADDIRHAHYLMARLALAGGALDEAGTALQQLERMAPRAPLTLDAQARVAHAQGNLDEAISFARDAVAAVENERAALGHARHRQSILSDRRGAYALGIDLLYQRYEASSRAQDLEAALQLAARGKALGLIETLPQVNAVQEPKKGMRHIEMFVSERSAHVWTIENGSATWRKFTPDALRRAARLVSRAAASGQALPVEERRILRDLLGDGQPDHLVLAPDGELVAVPFDLVYRNRTRTPVIRYVAAVALDEVKDTAPAPERPSLLVIANPSVPVGGALVPALRGLAQLKSVSQEASRIGAYFGSHAATLAGPSATETGFVSHAPTDVIHIASHAVFDVRLHDGAVLLLADDARHDGLLFSQDIAQLRRPARLTVLSACSTARGVATAGAPVSHLAGAFLAAGSRAVLASLWDVNDAATTVVMEQFYARLAQGMLPHDALHATKRYLSTQPGWDNPAIWAAWVVYGPSDQPVFAQQPNTTNQIALALWAVAALALLLGLLRQTYRRRIMNH